MPMPLAHQNFISHAQSQARKQLDEYGRLAQLNELWAGAANYDGLIDQASIDTVPSFEESGLTQADIADLLYALAIIKDTVTNALPAFVKVANLP